MSSFALVRVLCVCLSQRERSSDVSGFCLVAFCISGVSTFHVWCSSSTSSSISASCSYPYSSILVRVHACFMLVFVYPPSPSLSLSLSLFFSFLRFWYCHCFCFCFNFRSSGYSPSCDSNAGSAIETKTNVKSPQIVTLTLTAATHSPLFNL